MEFRREGEIYEENERYSCSAICNFIAIILRLMYNNSIEYAKFCLFKEIIMLFGKKKKHSEFGKIVVAVTYCLGMELLYMAGSIFAVMTTVVLMNRAIQEFHVTKEY